MFVELFARQTNKEPFTRYFPSLTAVERLSHCEVERLLILKGVLRSPYAGIISGPTLTMTRKTVSHRTATYVECARAQKANHVIPLTASLTPLYLGVFPTRETDTITGQDCTADWSGTATSVPP